MRTRAGRSVSRRAGCSSASSRYAPRRHYRRRRAHARAPPAGRGRIARRCATRGVPGSRGRRRERSRRRAQAAAAARRRCSRARSGAAGWCALPCGADRAEDDGAHGQGRDRRSARRPCRCCSPARAGGDPARAAISGERALPMAVEPVAGRRPGAGPRPAGVRGQHAPITTGAAPRARHRRPLRRAGRATGRRARWRRVARSAFPAHGIAARRASAEFPGSAHGDRES